MAKLQAVSQIIIVYSEVIMKKILTMLMVIVFAFSLIACGNSGSKDGGDATEGKLASIEKAGKIVVYTDPNFPPFEYLGETGPEGVDMEIAKAIAEELGVEVEFQEAQFDSIIMAIKGGKGDIAISGMTITEDRQKSVDFSDPYVNSVQYLMIPEDSSLTTVESLAGRSIGVAKGYTGSLLIDFEINDPEGALNGTDSSFTEYPSAMEATLDLNNGKVDCVIMDEHVAKNISEKTEGVKAIELKYDSGDLAAEEYGVVMAKGNEDLLEKINAVVKKLKDEGQIDAWMEEFKGE